MYNILTEDGVKVARPAEGIILSQTLAENLQAKVGSQLEIESPYAKDSPVYAEVVDIVPQYLGVNAYMEIGALGRLLGQEHQHRCLVGRGRGSLPPRTAIGRQPGYFL